jgi:hypothetical protein
LFYLGEKENQICCRLKRRLAGEVEKMELLLVEKQDISVQNYSKNGERKGVNILIIFKIICIYFYYNEYIYLFKVLRETLFLYLIQNYTI